MSVNVCTHSGKFHADEVMAVAILDFLYGVETIIRTRDIKEIEALSDKGFMVLDVGQIYDPTTKRFDHHQKSFVECFSANYDIPLSSCGLIYKYYGTECISKIMATHFADFSNQIDKEWLYNEIYKKCILEFDAVDNGIGDISESYKDRRDQIFKYHSYNKLGMIISRTNNKNVLDHPEQLRRFQESVALCKRVFERFLVFIIGNHIEFNSSKKRLLLDITLNAVSTGILVLDTEYNYYNALTHLDPNQIIKFIVLPYGQTWRIHTVRKRGGQFGQIADILPQTDAADLIGGELIFVHKNLFVAGTKTRDSAVALARASLKEHYTVGKRLFRLLNAIPRPPYKCLLYTGFFLSGILMSSSF